MEEKKGTVHYLEALDSAQAIGDSIRPNYYPMVSIVGINTTSSPHGQRLSRKEYFTGARSIGPQLN